MIRLEFRGAVGELTLEHGKVNALDREVLERLGEVLEEVEGSPARALVVTGKGSCFSAGVDLWRVLDGRAEYLEEFVPLLSETLRRLYSFPRPVVAALNGHAIAGGCVIALACDYRVMAAGEARIGVPELKVGVPFPPLAFEIVRSAVATPLLSRFVYRGELYGPEEARERGLIEEVVGATDLQERARNLAEELAGIPSETFRLTKLQQRRPFLERAAALGRELGGEVRAVWGSAEVMSAVREYMEATVRR